MTPKSVNFVLNLQVLQMKEKRYHPALKTLEQLEHNYLPRIANYR